MKPLHLVICGLLLAGVIGFGAALTCSQAQTIPASPGPYVVASDTVTVAQNVTMAMLGVGKITAAQAQDIATQCQTLRVEIGKGQLNPTDAQLTKVAALVDALQGQITALAHQSHP